MAMNVLALIVLLGAGVLGLGMSILFVVRQIWKDVIRKNRGSC